MPPSDDERLEGLTGVVGIGSGDFAALRSDGEPLVWDIYGTPPSSTGSPERFVSLTSDKSDKTVCGVTTSGGIDCFGSSFEGGGVPMPGTGWVSVATVGQRTAWTHATGAPALVGTVAPAGRPFADIEDSDLRSFVPHYFGGCGLAGSEFLCALGTDEWDIPSGPWLQVEPAIFESGSWCGLRSAGELECSSIDPASQIASVPAGVFTQLLFNATYWTTPTEKAWALDNLGNLHCWSSDGACSAPAGTFVQLAGSDAFYGSALLDDGTLVDLNSGATEVGEFFSRYVGSFGIRDDDTIGWWGEPARPVPAGTFDDVVPITSVYPAPGNEAVTTVACAVKTDGGLVCWDEAAGGGVTTVAEVSGDFRRIHYGSQLFLTDSSGHSRAFGGAHNGAAIGVATEYVPSFSAQCMIVAGGDIGCKGLTYDDPADQPPGAGSAYFEGLHYSSNYFCALADGQPVCWDQDWTVPAFPVLGVDPWLMVRTSPYQACAVRPGGRLVECAGSSPYGNDAQFPFPELSSGAIRDLATSSWLTCQIDDVGALQCVGVYTFDTGLPTGGPYTRIEIDRWSGRMCLIDEAGGLECFRFAGTANGWVSILTPAGSFTDVALGTSQICAVRSDTRAECWGVEQSMQGW